jgi:PAS domain S-box-containing protein
MKKGVTVHVTNPQDMPDWIIKALDSASCGITVADARQDDTPLIYVNRAFEIMTGYSKQEILGRNCRFLRGDDHDQPDLDILRKAMDERREAAVVLRNYRKDGTLFWNELRLSPVFNDQGQLTHYIGIQTDVTAQKEALAEVQAQSRRFYEILEAIPFGVLVLDAQGRAFFANKAASAITGKTFEPGAMIGSLATYCQATLAGTDKPYPLESRPIMRALRGDTVSVSDMEIRRDGRRIPLHVSAASPIHNQQGNVTHAVAIFADISEIREKENRLKEEEMRHRALLNSSLDAIITINASGTIQSVNPATTRIFGYSPDELLGRSVKMLMPEPYHCQHDRYLENYLNTGRARMLGTVREMSARRKDGTVFPIDLSVTEVKLPQGSLFKGIVRDISKRKETEALVAHTLAKLKKSQENLLVLLNQFRVGTLMLDADHRVEFVSESCEQFAGIDHNAAVGRPWDQVLPFGMQSKIQLQRLLDLPPAERYRTTLHWQCNGKACWVECDVRDDPQAPDRHILLLYDVTEIHQLRQTIDESRYGRMLGNCEPMRELYRLIDDIARGEWTVLIEGETGVGKELVAHSVHAASPRKDGPFIAVNSAGLSESLLTSQLFGHRKGAFTGAVSDQEGFFEAAHGGTLFLDEIGDLPLSMQASLLRVLQEKEITRLGDTKIRKVDVRILVATHKDLANEVREGRFREDLLYRLRVARLYVPALRERKADIPLLVEAFLSQSYHFSSRAQPRFGADALQCLMNYDWPGNVRELKACVDYAVIHSKGDRINPQDLPPEFSRVPASAAIEPEPVAAVEDERDRILAALEKTRGNRQQAAKLLGISRATFYRRLAELGVSPDR